MSGLSIALLIIRVVVALLLGRAAVAKLVDRGSARDGAEQLGVPSRFASLTAAVLPVAELAAAIGLLVTPVAGIAGIAAAAMFTAFTVLIGVNLGRGRRPDCNCFGSVGAEPIGVLTLVRNVVFTGLAVAVAVAWLSGRSLGAYRDLTTTQAWVLAGCAAFAALSGATAWVLVHLVRQNGRLLERVEALEGARAAAPAARRHRPKAVPIGSPAPAIEAVTLDERAVALGDLLDGRRPVVLVFVEPRCGACVALGDELALRTELFVDRRVVVIAHAPLADTRSKFGSITAADVLADPAGTTAAAYGVYGTPAAIVVTPDGRVASAIAEGRFDAGRLLDGTPPAATTVVSDGREVVRT
ncbi:MAG TPA: MauE/DoxX family redox-associated membrane protein [Ilumatobacter sp.]|nr:MauE/DoxX family redox-associated membrane protein [Ilumatobacter sp.]